MHRLLAAVLAGLLLTSTAPTIAPAEGRSYIGHGRLVTNDLLFDRRDRWRTGSVAGSYVWGPEWTGALPQSFGQVLEFRINGEIIAPENLSFPAPGDRPFAGALSLGLHTHHRRGRTEFALGGDLVITGPQTGFDHLQDALHSVLGGRKVTSRTRNGQIGNDINPTIVAEIGHVLDFGDGGASLRPFVEARAGVETLARAGVDFSFGRTGQNELLVRDPVTGHRYRSIFTEGRGLGFVLGGDIAKVDHSEFLPSNRGYELTDWRPRIRAGAHWQSRSGHRLFYGLTWLGKEFEGQRDSQVVGSLRINLKF
ncbi:lipid A deacylase LpxR family protein [Roseovarius sp. SCSIO 43702]|uniref:lipid A-modifier LpxR family protein n=1 Tax=Roseovarius sp. SCSIO 43702 TaxID=2823043 RepID=UPI001C739A59|nr:lipid A-modifier LpxR family protein [Roseovarius sp. SCSIO 43702]QYX56273.1 lipid A deacylase LpxR family protein [Roseovarius sp. SCSIO 43702]